MSKLRVLLLCALAVACAFGFSGCSGSNTITITLTPTTVPALNPGQTQAITATLTNDKNAQGVTWSLSGAGTLSNQTTTSVTYVAPSTVAAATSVTVTATSVANTSVTATLNISLNAVFAFDTTSLPAGTVNSLYNGIITVTGATAPFTWALTAGSLPPGLTLSNSTTASITITGTPTTVGTSTFTIQCIDSAGASVTETLSITINVPPPLSVATRSPLTSGTVGTAYTFTLQASSGIQPYTWTLTTGTLPPGLSLASNGVISGTPTLAGLYTFTVQVTDSSKPNPQVANSGNLSLTIAPSTNNALLLGNYAFLLSGFGPNGLFVAVGSFGADGHGAVSAGTMDSNTPNGQALSVPFTGTYSIFSNNLGTITLAGQEAGRIFYVALNSTGTSGKLIETDSTGTNASGVLLLQNTADFSGSDITGKYAFGFLGQDASSARYALAGQFAASSGAFGAGEIDSNDAGTPSNVICTPSNATCTGTYSVPTPSTSGRGTATITISGVESNYCFYIVSASQLLFIETDVVPGHPLLSGSMLSQSVFSFDGNSVFQTTALQAGGVPVPIGEVGLLDASTGGTVTANFDENTAGTMSTPSNTGSFSALDTFGRTVLTSSGVSGADSTTLYLVGPNEAFILGQDSNVTFGFMENQSVPSSGFQASSLSGNYSGGSVAPIVAASNNEVAVLTAANDSFDPITSDSSTGGLNQTSSATYSVGITGRTVLTDGNGTPIGFAYIVTPVGGATPSEFYELFTDPFAKIENFQQ